MNVMPKVFGIVVGAAMLVPLGCREKRVVVHRQGPPERVVVVERRPDVVVVERRPPVVVHPAPRPRVIYVPKGPPAPRREVMGRPPGPGHVWIGGHWDWHRDDYVWAPGRWAVPPRKGAAWVGHEWRHNKEGWRAEGGHWK